MPDPSIPQLSEAQIESLGDEAARAKGEIDLDKHADYGQPTRGDHYRMPPTMQIISPDGSARQLPVDWHQITQQKDSALNVALQAAQQPAPATQAPSAMQAVTLAPANNGLQSVEPVEMRSKLSDAPSEHIVVAFETGIGTIKTKVSDVSVNPAVIALAVSDSLLEDLFVPTLSGQETCIFRYNGEEYECTVAPSKFKLLGHTVVLLIRSEVLTMKKYGVVTEKTKTASDNAAEHSVLDPPSSLDPMEPMDPLPSMSDDPQDQIPDQES